ncbi:MAG: glycosyltransferase family 61 protein [Rhodomicrobium sp.]|nr:glycosyltransferase family 61 protein [Rhodomicrobium sp.]
MHHGERAEIRRYLWLYHGGANAEWLPADRDAAERLSGLLRQHYRLDEPQGGGLMFLSRGDAKQRRLINEDGIMMLASFNGFERFEAHAGNHAEQVRRFAEADAVIAVHGAGLTNMLFMRPGATVIEAFPADCVKSTYFWLARRLGLNYMPLIGCLGNYKQAFKLPPEIFITGLKEWKEMQQTEIRRSPMRKSQMQLERLGTVAAAR